MRGWIQLYRRFILRSMLRHKVPTATAVLGIALGVAVMLAIRLANRSVTESFRAAVDSVRGSSSLSIVGQAGRFDELRLAELDWLHEYGSPSPVIEGYGMMPDERTAADAAAGLHRPRGEMLQVLGADVLVDRPIRDYRLLRTSREARDPTTQELFHLLVDSDAVVLTERFAVRHGLEIGDRLPLIFGSVQKNLVIRGLLLDAGPARSLDGNFALMDIAAAQWAFGRLGEVDRIDLRLAEGADSAAACEEIARRLPAGLRVERPGEAYGRTETMIAAFHFNLSALSGIALLVGLFLIYNTASIGVASRREEIGVLQAVGAGPRTVLTLVLGETLLVTLAGLGLGLVFAQELARGAVTATARTVETFYIAQVAELSARQSSLSWFDAAMATAITVPLALVSAFWPAWKAATIQPVDVIRNTDRVQGLLRPPRWQLGVAALLALLGGGLAMLGPVRGFPLFGFVADVVFTLAGAFLVPAALWSGCWLVRRGLARLMVPWRAECSLAASNLLGAIGRLSTSIAALAASLSLMVAVAILVGSFRETVVYWLDSTLRADVMLRPITLYSGTGEGQIHPEAMQAIGNDPDVEAMNWLHLRQIPYRDTVVRLVASPLESMFAHHTILLKSPRGPIEPVLRAIADDAVLLSESFSLKFDKRPGDTVELPTPRGMQTFSVAAVYYDYASNQGTVLVDAETARRRFNVRGEPSQPSTLGLYLRPGADPDQVRARLARDIPGSEGLYIATNQNVRREAMRVFDSTFTITYALQAIAIVIACLGVVSTLLMLIYERRQEIALVSLTGATPGQVRRMVVLEAVLLGAVSQAIGVLIGLLVSLVLIYVINVQSFGWTIQFRMPLGFVAQSTLLILIATALCGFYPAIRAANVDALQTLREE